MSYQRTGGTLLYGVDASGTWLHISEAVRGEDCGCFCPDPRCGQPLIARKGERRAHHFAHKRGSCGWAVECVISRNAKDAIEKAGLLAFPRLSYFDAMQSRQVTHAKAGLVAVSSAELVERSGRGNPDVLVTVRDGRQFLVVVSLTHAVNERQIERIKDSDTDAFLIDLKLELDRLKKEDRHFDREGLPLSFQEPEFIASILLDDKGWCKRWLFNKRAKALEKQSRQELDKKQAEEKRRRKRAEEERLNRERMRREVEERESGGNTEETREGARQAMKAGRLGARKPFAVPASRVRRLEAFPSRTFWRCPSCGKDDQSVVNGVGEAKCVLCGQQVVL